MNTTLVSVIVPIYNVEDYLHQCINSILSQTYKNLQIILVDDGSSDASSSICDEYAATNDCIQVIHKKNGGLSDARNAGLEICNGEYVFFVDADDYLDIHCLETLLSEASTKTLAMTGYLLDFSDTGKILEPPQTYGIFFSIKDYLYSFHKLFAAKFNFAWGKLYSTEIINRYNLRFKKDIALVEDVIFNLDYYRYCDKFSAVSYNGYYYRQHGNLTLSKKFNIKMFEWNEYCYTTIRNYLKEFNAFTNQNRIHLYHNVAGNYHYSFYLVALDKQMKIPEKINLIRKYIKTPIYRDSLSVVKVRRIDYYVLYWCLHHSMFRTYILLEKIKNRILHGNNQKDYKKNERTM